MVPWQRRKPDWTMAYTKDLERVARTMAAQKMDHTYIRHYLMESYQLDAKTIDEIFQKLGIGPRKGPDLGGPAGGKKRQSFY